MHARFFYSKILVGLIFFNFYSNFGMFSDKYQHVQNKYFVHIFSSGQTNFSRNTILHSIQNMMKKYGGYLKTMMKSIALIYCINYSTILGHELAHYGVAYSLGKKPLDIQLYPDTYTKGLIGVSGKTVITPCYLSSWSLLEKITIFASGPLMEMIISLLWFKNLEMGSFPQFMAAGHFLSGLLQLLPNHVFSKLTFLNKTLGLDLSDDIPTDGQCILEAIQEYMRQRSCPVNSKNL